MIRGDKVVQVIVANIRLGGVCKYFKSIFAAQPEPHSQLFSSSAAVVPALPESGVPLQANEHQLRLGGHMPYGVAARQSSCAGPCSCIYNVAEARPEAW